MDRTRIRIRQLTKKRLFLALLRDLKRKTIKESTLKQKRNEDNF